MPLGEQHRAPAADSSGSSTRSVPALRPTPQTEHYPQELLDAALARMPEHALWLLLSIDHYGWRAHADLAHALSLDPPEVGGDLGRHLREHRHMAMVEELYLALDQLWRLVAAIQAHRNGEDLLRAYCQQDKNTEARFKALRHLSEGDWRALLAVPSDAEIRVKLEAQGADESEVRRAIAAAAEVIQLGPINAAEIHDLFRQPGSSIAGQQGHSVRTVNNRYRHGTRVLYEDCSPTTTGWTAANPHDGHGPVTALGDLDATAMEDVVNVLIAPPDDAGRAQVGSVAFGSPYGEKLVEAIGTVATVVKRLVTSFLRSEMMGGLPTLASIDDYSWSPPTAPQNAH